MKDLLTLSPARILKSSSQKGLGKGNLGAVIARAGVGKTACLIHIGLQHLFGDSKVVHISLKEGPDKVASYYGLVLADVARELPAEDQQRLQETMDRNRMILAYLNQSFDVARLSANLVNLRDHLQFRADVLIVDGLDFEHVERRQLEDLKKLAGEWDVELWFSVLSHRHIDRTNARGVPYPLDESEDLFGIILQLKPEASGIYLRFLKDHGAPEIPQEAFRLDPNSYLIIP